MKEKELSFSTLGQTATGFLRILATIEVQKKQKSKILAKNIKNIETKQKATTRQLHVLASIAIVSIAMAADAFASLLV